MVNSINNALHRMPRVILILLVCALVAIIGIIDYITSFDISISFFYLAPIFLATWYIDRTAGITLSITCAIIWFVTSTLTLPSRGIPMWILTWNAATRLGLSGRRLSSRQPASCSRSRKETGADRLSDRDLELTGLPRAGEY